MKVIVLEVTVPDRVEAQQVLGLVNAALQNFGLRGLEYFVRVLTELALRLEG